MNPLEKVISYIKGHKYQPREVLYINSELLNSPELKECDKLFEIITKIKDVYDTFESGLKYFEMKLADALEMINKEPLRDERTKLLWRNVESIDEDFLDYLDDCYTSDLYNAVEYAEDNCLTEKKQFLKRISQIIFEKYGTELKRSESNNLVIESRNMSHLWKMLGLTMDKVNEDGSIFFREKPFSDNIVVSATLWLDEKGLVKQRQLQFKDTGNGNKVIIYDDTSIEGSKKK